CALSCHTTVPYMLARPLLGEGAGAGGEIRARVEARVEHAAQVPAWYADKDAGSRGSEDILNALVLAQDDARSGESLRSVTRDALRAMWERQRADGAWDWLNFHLGPFEEDDVYGALTAAIAVGQAPGGYAREAAVRPGLEKLRRYLREHGRSSLHQRL